MVVDSPKDWKCPNSDQTYSTCLYLNYWDHPYCCFNSRTMCAMMSKTDILLKMYGRIAYTYDWKFSFISVIIKWCMQNIYTVPRKYSISYFICHCFSLENFLNKNKNLKYAVCIFNSCFQYYYFLCINNCTIHTSFCILCTSICSAPGFRG